MKILQNDWAEVIGDEFQKEYYQELRSQLKEEYTHQAIYPDMNDIFNALHYTPFANTKVVILGQDPYHGPEQAHGLSFSVKRGINPPPSLQNILKELAADLGYQIPDHGHLTSWAEQGVLLLNTVLTVRRKEPNSHKDLGWETFTNRIIQEVNAKQDPVVFMLWGKHAQRKKELISNDRHLVIESPHPSPFSAHRGFFGSHPFSRANEFLEEQGREKVNWQLPE
ncbi:uracil-DNA glycosylase [Salsuginibacillus kocurii]|uniref:uracil-DNA glycosylase n=1 Tax=Salsuginibacillus kocurii TaxID=427078 RepID=UPI00037987E9|nr:uracil-DNA glycosylase [Salsuginibacillus kocurii]